MEKSTMKKINKMLLLKGVFLAKGGLPRLSFTELISHKPAKLRSA